MKSSPNSLATGKGHSLGFHHSSVTEVIGQGDFFPQGTLDHVWRLFSLSQVREGNVLGLSRVGAKASAKHPAGRGGGQPPRHNTALFGPKGQWCQVKIKKA